MAAFRAVIATEPDHPHAHHGLATVLGRKRRHAEAIDHFRVALERTPDNLDAMAGMVSAMTIAGRHAEAIAIGRRAVALRPDFAPAASTLGLALAEMGEMGEALTLSRRAVTLSPDGPEFCFNLVLLTKIQPGDAVLDTLEAMLPRATSFSAREQCWLHFALAKALDDIGERDRGFAHVLRGNAIKRAQIEYQ